MVNELENTTTKINSYYLILLCQVNIVSQLILKLAFLK